MVTIITKQNVKYSLRNLFARKTRSFLTLFSILIGIVTIFIFVSFGWGLFDYVNDFATGSGADKLTVQARSAGAPGTSPFIIDESDLDVVEKTNGVKEVEPAYFDFVEVNQDEVRKYVYIIGMDWDSRMLIDISDVDIIKGRELQNDDYGKVVLGYNYQLEDVLFPKAYKVNDKIELNGEKYKIVGFYDKVGNPQDDSNIYMGLEAFERDFESESYDYVVARADIENIDDVVERIEKNLRKHRGQEEGQEDFFVATFTEQIEAFSSALNIVIGFVVLIALISVVVSAVNTANTMVTSVIERTQEIGIIKSIGAKNSEIFNIFLFESSFLGFVAGIIGVFIGWLISFGAGVALDAAGWGFLSPHFSWILFAGCISFATIVGAISGVIPAVDASKRKPVDALRYE